MGGNRGEATCIVDCRLLLRMIERLLVGLVHLLEGWLAASDDCLGVIKRDRRRRGTHMNTTTAHGSDDVSTADRDLDVALALALAIEARHVCVIHRSVGGIRDRRLVVDAEYRRCSVLVVAHGEESRLQSGVVACGRVAKVWGVLGRGGVVYVGCKAGVGKRCRSEIVVVNTGLGTTRKVNTVTPRKAAMAEQVLILLVVLIHQVMLPLNGLRRRSVRLLLLLLSRRSECLALLILKRDLPVSLRLGRDLWRLGS